MFTMAFLLRYLFVFIACVFMLLGMQLPNLVDQYAKRVDASLREVTLNFQPFQIIANQHTGGSVEALIKLHRDSNVAPFKAEGDAIDRMYQRKITLEFERLALDTHLPGRLWQLLVHADRDLREQTLVQYSPNVPLTQEALVSWRPAGAVHAAPAGSGHGPRPSLAGAGNALREPSVAEPLKFARQLVPCGADPRCVKPRWPSPRLPVPR
jgi:hypothetical protein